MTIDQLARKLAVERLALDAIEADVKEVKLRCDQLEAELFDAIENAGLRAIKVDNIGTFSLNDLAWARIADRQAALEWAEANMPEILTLNHTSLSMLVRAAIKGEGDMPAGVEFTTSRKISWRKT